MSNQILYVVYSGIYICFVLLYNIVEIENIKNIWTPIATNLILILKT